MYALPRNVDQKPASFRLPPQIALEGSISPPLHTPVYMDIYTFLERYRCRPSIQVVTDFVAAHTVAYDTPNWRQLTRHNSTKILANYLENYLHKNRCPLSSMIFIVKNCTRPIHLYTAEKKNSPSFRCKRNWSLELKWEGVRYDTPNTPFGVSAPEDTVFILIYFQFYFHVFKVYFPEL